MKGFSLLEILIALAIVSILSAISIPLYSQHVTTAKRLEAALTLNKVAVALERYFTTHNTYAITDLAELDFTEQINSRYELKLAAATNEGFEVEARPLKTDVLCGTLSLNEQGEKKITGSASLAECW